MSGRVLLAGTGSGCGKTSITCGILAALSRRGVAVSACKCGPDYIDPLFHREVVGVPSRNLDLFLSGEDGVRSLLAKSADHLTIIEGVMGFYDGLGGTEEASSCHLARCTGTPVVLVASCSGKALSLAAEIYGYLNFGENNIAGVILNRTTAATYPMLKAAVEERCGVPVLGWLPTLSEAALESRHLGLVTAGEVENLQHKIDLLARQVAETVDLDALLSLANSAPPLEVAQLEVEPEAPVRIAVARDAAFCFVYEDNLALLAELGAEIVPFSPLTDTHLPPNIHGLILPGGYPELYAAQLSGNTTMLADLHRAVTGGLPTIAECGGFLLLCRTIRTVDGAEYPMAGVIDTATTMTRKLAPFGYITMTARVDNLLCGAGEQIPAHTFHYSQAEEEGSAFHAVKQSGKAWDCVHATATLYAGYPHLHLVGHPDIARRFLRRANQYKHEEEIL